MKFNRSASGRSGPLFRFLSVAGTVGCLSLCAVALSPHRAWAGGAADPFSTNDTNEPPDPSEDAASTNGAPNGYSISAFFGETYDPNKPAYDPDASWEDLDHAHNGLTEAREQDLIKNSPEMRIERELDTDLPQRHPFGDKLDDVEKRLTR